jgi:hypothetical protein
MKLSRSSLRSILAVGSASVLALLAVALAGAAMLLIRRS